MQHFAKAMQRAVCRCSTRQFRAIAPSDHHHRRDSQMEFETTRAKTEATHPRLQIAEGQDTKDGQRPP